MTREIAIEIYTNPDDLCISLPTMDGQCGILISRGPKGHFERLFMSEPKFTKEKAISVTQLILRTIDDERNKKDISWVNVLTEEKIEEIVQSLKEKGVAETFEVTA